MQWVCDTDALSRAVAVVERAAATTVQPGTQGMRLEAAGDRLRLAATDLELAIEAEVPATVPRPGRAVVDARLLSRIVRHADGATVEMEEADQAVVVSSGTAQWSLDTTPPDVWPGLPSLEEPGPPVTVPARLLAEMVRQTAFAAANDSARPFMSGVLVEVEGEVIRMAATDASRLAVREASLLEPAPAAWSAIVPTRALREAARLCESAEAEQGAVLTPAKGRLMIVVPGATIITRLIEGQFPNYRAVMPGDMPYRVQVRREEFAAALERVLLIVRKGPAFVGLRLAPGRLTAWCREREVGEASEDVEAIYDGQAVEFGFQARYLLDMLKATDADEVLLEMADTKRPARLRPAGDDSYVYVVMPAILPE